MDPPQDQHGGSSTNHISIEVNGVRSINIPDSSLLEMSKPSKLSYYRGYVKSGHQSDELKACDVIILKFKESAAALKYDRLAAVHHPCILGVLGHGKGLGDYREHSFLALKPFEVTFEAYIVKNGPGIDQNGRFTEDFIKLISDIIDGIEELHRLGYCCPYLKGDDIAVIRCDSISAKIWNFRICKSEDEDKTKSEDWPRLGYMIATAAAFGDEATDLYDRIKSGQLKGRSILRHSALLTVREKFKNVLALYSHVSLNCKEEPEEIDKAHLEVSKICVANLESDLDKSLSWAMPHWICTSQRKTLRGFINQLRILVAHEVLYIPAEITEGLTFKRIAAGEKVMDLDHHLKKSCSKLYWAVQMLVAELNLIY